MGVAVAPQPWSGLLLDRQERLGDGADHPVHRAGLAVPRRVERLPRRQPEQRQLRLAQVDQQQRLQHGHRDDGRHAPRRPSTSPSPAGCPPAPCTCGRPTCSSNNPADYFVRGADLTPSSGTFSLTVQPGYVYTLTTTTGQGKGTATSPAQGTASRCRTATPSTATPPARRRSTSWTCRARSRPWPAAAAAPASACGRCREQAPIYWTAQLAEPFTLLGDLSWSNYTVSSDVMLEKSGYAQLIGRASTPTAHLGAGATSTRYYLRVTDTGALVDPAATTPAATVRDPGQRHHGRAGHRTLAQPGADVQRHHASPPPSTAPPSAPSTDATWGAGQVGYGTGQGVTAQFDNLSITPGDRHAGGPTGVLRGAGSGRCLDVPGASPDQRHAGWRSGTATAAPTSSGPHTSSNELRGLRQQVPGRAAATPPPPAPACRSGAATAAPTSSGASTPTARSSGSSPGCAWTSTGAGTANGTAVQLWTCNGGSNQRWART